MWPSREYCVYHNCNWNNCTWPWICQQSQPLELFMIWSYWLWSPLDYPQDFTCLRQTQIRLNPNVLSASWAPGIVFGFSGACFEQRPIRHSDWAVVKEVLSGIKSIIIEHKHMNCSLLNVLSSFILFYILHQCYSIEPHLVYLNIIIIVIVEK